MENTDSSQRRAILKPKEDKHGSVRFFFFCVIDFEKVVVHGLTEKHVWDYRSARKWLDLGLKARNVKATDLNQDSSRYVSLHLFLDIPNCDL